MADIVSFYGVIKEILMLDYHMFQIQVFRCIWANKGNGVKEEDGFTLVNLHMNQLAYLNDPFILASQAKQVFYSREDDSSPWYVCMRAPPRGYHELETVEEFVSAPLSVQPIEDLGDQSSDDESFCVSKRQAGLDVTPVVSLKKKKRNKKSIIEENERDNEEERIEVVTEGDDGVEEEDINGEEDIEEQENGAEDNEEQDNGQSQENERDNEEVEEHSAQIQEDRIPPSTAGASETQTHQSDNKKRKSRGPTRMRKVAKNLEDKVEVEFNALGEHVGKGSVTLSSFLGPLVREHVPVLLDDWRQLDQRTKDVMWEEIQGRFNIKEDWQKEAVFRQMGGLWRAAKSKLVTKVRSTKSKVALQQLKPSNIQCTSAWNSWVKNKCTAAFKERSEKYRQLRKGQIPHTTSRKGMTRLAGPRRPSKTLDRHCLWRAAKSKLVTKVRSTKSKVALQQLKPSNIQCTSAWNSWVKNKCTAAFKERSEKYRQLRKGQIPHTTSRKGMTRLADEMVWIAGHTHSDGRPVREEFAETIEMIKTIDSEMDSTTSTDNVREDATRDSHVKKLEASQAELLSKLENLQNVVSNLASKKRQIDDVSMSDLSNVSKGGVRCQLLDWCLNVEVVVGEGEFYSSEHTYKIGRIPLGRNAADPTDESLGRIKIFQYWSGDDELIVEGMLLSTDHNELVDGRPLGHGAAVVKVLEVVKPDAYLWRPNPPISLMSDALNETIAWPIDRIQLLDVPANDESTRKSPQVKCNYSQCYTLSTASSKGAKQKCFLLNIDNTGQRVAIGRVSSTDPAEKVHHVPLGANASKVWVEVSKVEGVVVSKF
ncbi:unnamed protein product [Arabidopsis arenosa]|uniref:DUF4216 domain-containing protein n=1 Tax=Arabidopsis arenosa TaxID=38785 RepID=A0A8S2A1H5_ARAAE|nr:unnamed protein product [Arabidopsis arenosa]